MILKLSKTIFVFQKILMSIKLFFELIKFRLSLLVTFSSVFGFLLSSNYINYFSLFILIISGFFITGSSIINNQIIEKDSDKLMNRTKNRPLPTNKISSRNALFISLVLSITGLILMVLFLNKLTALLSFFSLIIYTFLYTPLKKVGPIAVFVGAIPGALPPLIGWAASTNDISLEALIIFSIQFIWQFPHFWAIAWVSDDDYKRAGFKLLPNNGKKNFSTAVNIMTYTMFLIPLGLLPTIFGITGLISGVVAVVCAILFLIQTLRLIKDYSRTSALRIMFGSFIYLPVVQLTYIFDKI
ncbi:MAG TPA: protoheme IX farnesyltransferase [Cytophagales bacterium]|jgi:protoheme IX farnesyltransferase|nr:protoheme IX farnesyltransferase [Cytophagales bacterium]